MANTYVELTLADLKQSDLTSYETLAAAARAW